MIAVLLLLALGAESAASAPASTSTITYSAADWDELWHVAVDAESEMKHQQIERIKCDASLMACKQMPPVEHIVEVDKDDTLMLIIASVAIIGAAIGGFYVHDLLTSCPSGQ